MKEQNLTSKETTTKLTISKTAINYLIETGKWTKFLSIIGFVFIGLIVIVGLFMSSILSSWSNGKMDEMSNGIVILYGGVYLLTGLLYFFATWYLLKFSQKLKLAISTKNKNDLNIALCNQKSFYKFWGILMIIFIAIYVKLGLTALIGISLV